MQIIDKKVSIQLLALLLCICSYEMTQIKLHQAAAIIAAEKSAIAKSRRKKSRIPFSQVDNMLNDRQFRRMFRMTRECFALLSDKIKINVGESKFKSQVYIDTFLNYPGSIYQANCETTGGFISGEVKLAITIRLLAGGDCLDLGVMFDISSAHCNTIMYEVLNNWINKTKIGDIDIYAYLNNEIALKKESEGFSKRSNGVLVGAIGAIDGWLVKIQKPSYRLDNIRNTLSFFHRRDFLH